ncbi:MAG: outer membrane beta-barrel domain-containing protein [Deltaproteobacteria bacterium]|nr:MAG: outer membrane beta-barrel domain-containing protein [Deltaproteobacteria bacterium]
MKTILALLLSFAFAFGASPLYAANNAERVELSPFMGYAWFDDDLSIDDAPVFGVRLGYFLTETWEAELSGYLASSEYDGGNDVNVFSTDVDALYNFPGYGNFLPYLGAGVGLAGVDPQGESADYEFTANAAAGVRYFVTEDVAIRGDIREVHIFDDGDWNFIATVGLSLFFGGEMNDEEPAPAKMAEPAPAPAPMAAPAPVDSDNDGIVDAKDRCPGTPKGAKVDSSGCELDSDGDGVVDSKDKCPGTVKGAKVDMAGCEVDSDGDGVVDSKDACAGTPRGVKVDMRGCRIDTDGDGVWDEEDKCPTTPKGVPVDKEGCNVKKVSIKLEAEFDTGKAEIRKESYPEVDKVGEFMVKYTSTNAVIEGHTDSVGSSESNQALSQRRAEAVREYLIKNFDIAPSRVTAKGYGEEKPVATNDTPEGRQMNRRIEAVIETVIKQ